jgi:hypothetical protein
MAHDPGTVRFPMACPTCSAVTAMPYAATTAPEGVTSVGMRCRKCGHEWRVLQPASSDVTQMRSGVRLPLRRATPDEAHPTAEPNVEPPKNSTSQ